MKVNKKTKKTAKPVRRKKPRRRIRWSALLLIAAVIGGLVYLVTMPYRNDNRKLAQMGYDRETIEAIREKELLQTILDGGYYSDSLASAIRDGTLRTDYISLYTYIPDRKPEALDFLLYRRLEDVGYEEDQLENLFSSLSRDEITPLLVFDYQWDDQGYIDDVIENREGGFDLSADYRQLAKVSRLAEDPGSVQVLVNRRNFLSDSFVPEGLRNVSDEFSIAGTQLRREAADAAVKMCQGGMNAGAAFFICDSYWDYESLQELNDSYLTYLSETEADVLYAKPGFNEHQTGLAINVAATYEDAEDFADTEAYRWLHRHADTYGFIERYPEERMAVTGRQPEPSHYRFVGVATAKAVKASKLTYDEFYCLYLKGWENPELEPVQSILSQIEWYHMTD